jgi:hypothetical protein
MEWVLIDKTTGEVIREGSRVVSFRGSEGVVEYMRPPHKPSSCGHVTVGGMEYYVTVFNLKWEQVA